MFDHCILFYLLLECIFLSVSVLSHCCLYLKKKKPKTAIVQIFRWQFVSIRVRFYTSHIIMYSRIVIYFLYKQPDRQIIRCPNPRSSRLSTLVSVLKGKLHKHSSFIRQTPPCFRLENPQRNLVLIQCTLLPWTRCPQVPRISLFSRQEEGTEQPALRPRVSSATSAPEPSEVSVTSLERFNIQNKSVRCWCTALLNTNAVHM